MNIPRLLIALVVGFIFVFASDFVIHALWLAGDYKATAQLWRPDPEMQARFHWMLVAQFLIVFGFVMVWAKGFAGRSIGTGAFVGLYFGLAVQAWAIIFHVVAPLPADIATKWFLVGVLQAILLGIVVAAIYKPKAIPGRVG